MSHSIFVGSAAAVVTPMNGYGNLDFDAFGRLLEWMIREGTDAVVVNGTTGESATLDDKEKMAVIRYAVRRHTMSAYQNGAGPLNSPRYASCWPSASFLWWFGPGNRSSLPRNRFSY